MGGISRYFKVTLRLLKATLMSEMEYKVNFITSFFLINAWLVVNIIFFKAIYLRIDFIGNWTENQALLFVAVFNIIDSVFFLFFFRGLLSLEQSVSSGLYDYILVKPMNSIFLTCFNRFDISRIVNIFFSFLFFLYVARDFHFSPLQFSLFLLMMLNGTIIYGCIFFMVNTLAFYFTNVFSFISLFFDFMEVGRLPPTVAGGFIRDIFMFVMPLLFIAGIPCEYLFSQNDYRLVLMSTGVMILFVLLSILFFKRSVQKYSSASS